MSDKQTYTALLALTEPWYIGRIDADVPNEEFHIFIEHRHAQLPCPECGKICNVYDHAEERVWRHLDLWQCKTLLHARMPRTDCAEHGIKRVNIPWAEPGSRFSLRMERHIIETIKACETVRAACTLLDVGWDQVRGVMERAVERGEARKQAAPIRYLGIDEKAILKGHRYATLIYDIDRGVVDEVTKDRTIESLKAYYSTRSSAQIAAIDAICMDMWEPYRQATFQCVPLSGSMIVHDRFHIIAHMNKALNEVRAEEARELAAKGDKSLKGTRQLWLWGEENVPTKREPGFAVLKRSDLRTAGVWAGKENLRRLWCHRSEKAARKHFATWHRWMTDLGHKAVTRVADMIKDRLDQVVSYCHHPISNGVAEGLNSKIMGIQRRARGYRHFETFRMAILFFCGGLDLMPSAHTH